METTRFARARALAGALLASTLLLTATVHAAESNVAARPAANSSVQRHGGGEQVTLNFINADIEGVVRAIAEVTGRSFVIDPRVKGNVTIVSAKPMSKALVYDVFLSALRLQGYAAVEDRGITRIVPESDARLQSARVLGNPEDTRAHGELVQTQVFTLKYESATQLVPILRPLIAPSNTITAYPANNTLIITDYAANLRRIEKIIDSIDQPSGSDPIVIPLQHASAVDVAQMVNRLFADLSGGQGAAGLEPNQRMTVIADTRSNSLLARSDNPSRLARLRSLVASLDSPTNAAGNIHVVHLKNAEAVKVAETLRAIYQNDANTPARPVAAVSPLAPPPPPPGTLAALPQANGTVSGSGMIQADAATNSIIITASEPVYASLRAALDKLDVRRAQVYVEALVAELTAAKAAEFGIQFQDLSGTEAGSGTQQFGGTNFGGPGQNILGIAANPLSTGRGLNVGIVRGIVNVPGFGAISNIGLLVRALEADNNANILSTPTLLTLDNEEARIIIGQNVPFITGQYALSGAATTPTPFQTIERRDVGLTLRIKPQISEGGAVRLQIYQEVSSIQDRTNPAGVITNKRAVESTVLVDDGQIVAIGGLIQDAAGSGIEKVPFLGDLPIIGALFQYRTRNRNKTNLMVFLRPTLLRDASGADALATDRYNYILGEQYKARNAPGFGRPADGGPLLPALPSPPPAAR